MRAFYSEIIIGDSMKRAIHGCVMLLATALVVGCSGGGGQYVGKWVDTRTPTNRLTIEPNGGNYMVRWTYSMAEGYERTNNMPAAVKAGVLEAQLGSTTIHYAIDNATGYLTDGNRQFKQVK
jgi:hypothetical protein